MGFLPSRMSRLLVGGHKDRMAEAIDVLHAQGVLHVEDYHDPTGIARIGAPLPAGAEASALLVRARGLAKAIGSEGMAPAGPTPSYADAGRTVADAEADAGPTLEQARALREEWNRLEAEEAVLSPLAGLDVDLAHATGLRSVRVLVGTTRIHPSPALERANVAHEAQVAPAGAGYAVAVVVATASAGPVERALAESGFAAAQVPAGNGTPAARLSALAAQKAELSGKLSAAENAVAALRAAWGGRLAAAEATLANLVDKTQAPLRFGVTQTTFNVEGWVPRQDVKRVEEALLARFGDALYFHDFGDAPPGAPGAHGGGPGHGEEEANGAAHTHANGAHDHGHAHGDAHGDTASGEHGDDHREDDPERDPPIHLGNARGVKPYEWMLSLLARPRYNEVDPSTLLFVFFPIFFGLMVGDVVTGLLILLFGMWLRRNAFIGIGGPAVGKALMAGGLFAMLFGLLLYGEAMGIHFVVGPDSTETSWAQILHLHIASGSAGADPFWTTLPEGGSHPALVPGGLFAPHDPVHLMLGPIPLGIYSKLEDVQPLMVIALIIATIHMVLGLLLGVRNVRAAHGTALAIQEKGAFVLFLVGLALAVVGAKMPVVLWAGVAVCAASLGLLWVGAAKVYGMGFVGPMELISLGGNFVSYTRLAAIAAAEAGLGLAVYTICFHTLPGGAIGWLLYVVCFLGLTLLSILSGGLQSLRLQFVEFFGKFFTGGGRPYVPFGRRAP